MKRSRVVFVRPPNRQKSGQWKKQGVIRCPLNLAMLAAYVRERGPYDCRIVDFEVAGGETPAQMADAVLAHSPRYVCLTTLSPRFPTTVRIAQEIRRKAPEVVTIIGGPHVTGAPEHSMAESISYGITGEGEEALLELLGVLEEGRDPRTVRNLVWRDGAQVVVNPVRPFIHDLDSLPFPAWDLMRIPEYVDPAYFVGPHLAVFSSRGCPHDCTFCASGVTWKRKFRLRSVENVLAELRQIAGALGVRNIMFWDDNFAANEARAIAICRRMVEENLQLRYVVQVRADEVTRDLMAALKESGCRFAAIGVESGNEAMLRRINKNETKDEFRRAMRMMREAGVPSIASYILGLPGDTHETIRETIEFAFELNADQSKFMILTPCPGTEVYRLAQERGLVHPDNFDELEALNYYDSVAINLSNVSDADLLRYQDEAYARFDAAQTAPELNSPTQTSVEGTQTMKVETTQLDGVRLIRLDAFEDHRGQYVEIYNEQLYRQHGVEAPFVQDDISTSSRHVLRGIHGDSETWKLISCLFGKFYLVVFNGDLKSPDFGRWQSFVLSDSNRLQVLVPPKYGNGHLVLSEQAIFHYKQSTYYNPKGQFTIKWDDPRFNIWWPVRHPILSQRDERGGFVEA